ncbi:permease-like cell division protein FtsX [Nonomuraea sp. NPDC050310]|uniref:permease-like cell division protein FtsX n=1 Tax=unclassified Nonomuraea TaxID=2593643 RepID=UPI0033F13A80
MRANFILSEVWIGLRRNLTMTIAVIVTVAVGMAMLGVGFLISAQVSTMKDYWFDKVEVSVFLCTKNTSIPACKGKEASPDQTEALKTKLEGLPEVKQVHFEDQAMAYENFRKTAVDKTLLDVTKPEDMPTSFRVQLKDPELFQPVIDAVTGQPGVSSIKNQKELLNDFFGMLDALRTAAFVLAGFVVIASILLIANTVRLSAFNRRRETGIMRLVGASNLYIQLPFVMEGMISGLIGGVFAAVMLILAKVFVFEEFQKYLAIGSQLEWETVAWVIVWTLGIGVLICILSSFVTLRRYLRV